jgi:hypothetical protein
MMRLLLRLPLRKETAAHILKESMIDAGKMYLKDVPVLVDVSVVDNWYEK